MTGRKTILATLHLWPGARAVGEQDRWRQAVTAGVGWGLVLLLGACPGEGASSVKDKDVEGGLADGGQQDLVISRDYLGPDMTYGERSCLEVLACIGECLENDCVDACLLEGTAPAQRQILELVDCTSSARTITCELRCQDEQSAECYDCVDETCADERHHCMFGYAELSGFGQLCDEAQTACPEPLVCVSVASAQQGFCTYPCSQGELCPGAPLGTYAQCLLSSGGSNVCGFVCEFKDRVFECPAQLVCSQTELQPASGMYLCVEPS